MRALAGKEPECANNLGFLKHLPSAFQKAENIDLIFRGLSPPVSPRREMVSPYTF